jgi:nucleotide-binding universal stress UspA family protein
MATHGRHGVAALLRGSETPRVPGHCSIPVLVVR